MSGWRVLDTMHDGSTCTGCQSCVAQARTMAAVTGSVGATWIEDHRDPDSGDLVVDHSATVERIKR